MFRKKVTFAFGLALLSLTSAVAAISLVHLFPSNLRSTDSTAATPKAPVVAVSSTSPCPQPSPAQPVQIYLLTPSTGGGSPVSAVQPIPIPSASVALPRNKEKFGVNENLGGDRNIRLYPRSKAKSGN